MSKFSTINSQHSALRELERQRLERMMGQLRKEVGSRGSNGIAPACGDSGAASRGSASRFSERRFQPPRRKDGVRYGGGSGTEAPSRDSGRAAISFRAKPECPASASVDAEGDIDAIDPNQPGPRVELSRGEGAPSVEIAWLLSMSNRMEEDAAEVVAFLSRHDLDRYASLLTGPGAPGTSMDALGEVDDAGLAELGLPPSPRLRLRVALQAELEARLDAMRPSSSVSCSSVLTGEGGGTAESDGRRWRRLGFVPQGWSRVQPQPPSHPASSASTTRIRPRTGPVVLVDCGIGDDVADRESDNEQGPFSSTPSSSVAVGEPVGVRQSPFEQPWRLESVPPSHGGTPAGGSRPGSRPGTSSGAQRVCCYECYKQVPSQHAISAADECMGVTRRFCSDACVARHRSQIAARDDRARELEKLRGAVLLAGSGVGDVDIDGCITPAQGSRS